MSKETGYLNGHPFKIQLGGRGSSPANMQEKLQEGMVDHIMFCVSCYGHHVLHPTRECKYQISSHGKFTEQTFILS